MEQFDGGGEKWREVASEATNWEYTTANSNSSLRSSLGQQKGRFRNQLLKKIILAGKKVDDVSISPVVRQTLWHWGFEPTEEKMLKFKKLKGL